MFQKQRLLRDQWPSAQMLAEELYAMFQDDIPLKQKAPLTLQPSNGQPGLTIDQLGNDTGPVITVKRNGTPVGTIVPTDNGLQLGDKNGNPTTGANGTAILSPPPQTVFVGQIVSGSGDTYQVHLFRRGVGVDPVVDGNGNNKPFTAKCVDIANAETIPPNRRFIVVLVGPITVNASTGALEIVNGQYVLQAPIFEYTS